VNGEESQEGVVHISRKALLQKKDRAMKRPKAGSGGEQDGGGGLRKEGKGGSLRDRKITTAYA